MFAEFLTMSVCGGCLGTKGGKLVADFKKEEKSVLCVLTCCSFSTLFTIGLSLHLESNSWACVAEFCFTHSTPFFLSYYNIVNKLYFKSQISDFPHFEFEGDYYDIVNQLELVDSLPSWFDS